MNNLENLLNLDTIEQISDIVEEKMHLLNQIEDFHKKDQSLAILMEKLENSLSNDLKEQFDDIMRLNYQVESYYFALTYFLGKQSGSQEIKI